MLELSLGIHLVGIWAGIYLAHEIRNSEGAIPRSKVNSAQWVAEKLLLGLYFVPTQW